MVSGKPLPQTASHHRFSFYCDEWLRNTKNKVKESTYVKYTSTLEHHIKPHLGGCIPLGMSSGVIDRFSEILLCEEGLSPKTVKDILVTLRSILNYTAKQYPGKFPPVEITYPKESKKEMRVLSRNEQTRFITFLLQDVDSCKLGVLLALLTGLRIGEICALRWEDISQKDRTIKISSTLQRLKNLETDSEMKTKILIGSPKSDTSLRTIPLTDYAAELCGRMRPSCSAAFLLTGTLHYMEPRTLQYRFEKYTRQCGLEGVHFHTLRHTFATRCVESGFEIKSLSEILGHASTSITMDRYVHSSMDLKRSNMNKVDMLGA